MRVAAAVALLAGVVAVAAARAPGTAPAGQLQFAPAPGWTEVAQGGSVIAATVPIEDSPQTAHADLTVHDLPTDAVVITASIRRPEHETYSDAAFPERSLPLSLADADVRHSFEAQPNPEVPEYVLWQRVNGYVLDVRVFFGNQEPAAAQLSEAQGSSSDSFFPRPRRARTRRGRST